MTKRPIKKRVLVALSGGVDSSVAAALLQESGYEVNGAIMMLEGLPEQNIELAAAVADRLTIPFHRFDFTKEHSKNIIDYFVAEYEHGRTPNPCVLCNKVIKLGLFMQAANELDIPNVATGHYARNEQKNGRYLLKKGIDNNEQSYFLYCLSQRQLSRTIFPLGRYTKNRVRPLARAHGLPTAQHKKSQDVCFIPDGDYASFLKQRVRALPGPVLDSAGKVIGEHKGIIYYTIGQRHGIGISHTRPYYVTRIDVRQNAIYIGEKKEVYKREFIVTDANFIPFDTLEQRMTVSAKVRYFSEGFRATVDPLDAKRIKVTFEQPQWAITPGQSAVFYKKNLVIGGGTIEQVLE
jgi:tRNA-specific 2-thiouridylase